MCHGHLPSPSSSTTITWRARISKCKNFRGTGLLFFINICLWYIRLGTWYLHMSHLNQFYPFRHTLPCLSYRHKVSLLFPVIYLAFKIIYVLSLSYQRNHALFNLLCLILFYLVSWSVDPFIFL